MQQLVLTTRQRLQMHRDQEISVQYKKLRDENPTASDRRIIETIAASRTTKPLKAAGIRLSLVRSGAITPNAKSTEK